MAPAAATILMLAMLVPAAASPAPPTSSISGVFPVQPQEWVAVRANVSWPNDLFMHLGVGGCNQGENETMMGVSILRIKDGAASIGHHVPATTSWSMATDMAEAGIEGNTVRQPPAAAPVVDLAQCRDIHDYFWNSAHESAVLVAISRMGGARAEYDASWSYGVQSVEVVRGQGLMLRAAELDHGAAGAVYPFASASAVALASHALRPTRDLVGWFQPAHGGIGPEPLSSCRKNGAPCPEPNDFGVTLLQSKGATAWDLKIDAHAQVGGRPHHVLGAIELPDDTWLAEQA